MASKKTLRQEEIINLLRVSPALRIADLAEKLNVTTETIRRDFDEMDQKGLLERTYGGAILRMSSEPGLNVRHSLLVEERESIARAVVQEIKGARHFMIGSGATTVHIARRMAAELRDITVIAHSFGVVTQLVHNPTIRVIMAPGFYHGNEGANHGAYTVDFLDSFWVDYAILGASGLTNDGPCDALVDAGEVYAKMIGTAFQTVIAADKSKFNLKFPAKFAKWKDVDYLVTDQKPPEELLDSLIHNRVALKLANVS